MTTESTPVVVPPPLEPAPVRWHLIVGILGLLYGLFGLFAHTLMISSVFFFGAMMRMSGMGDISMPTPLKLATVASSGILLVLGVILVVGSVLVLRRRPLGATLMKLWAGARVVMVLVGVAVGFLMMPKQIDFQMEMVAAQRSMLRERNVPEDRLPPEDREFEQKKVMWSTLGFGVVALAFPLFVGVLFTNRRKLDDVESWKLIER
ncbi:MAG: hypothetical protein JNM94_07470 [Phycisphaerae bacterium]|nr:hypothetical protein [Phycisphaerae bacterium]